MIKVIEHGNKTKTHRCKNCGCLFSYTPADIVRRRVGGNMFEKAKIERLGLQCPECIGIITVKELEKDE